VKTLRDLYSSSRRAISLLLPWLCFGCLFVWGYRVRNIFTDIPAYGDALEVLWGAQWYRDAIFRWHSTPFFTSIVFHPVGWHTTTLAHTPALFLSSLPLSWMGGIAFSYNILVILAVAVSFAGMVRFSRLYVSPFLSVVVSLAFAFWRWGRVGGHVHMLWAWGLLPWLAWAVEHTRRARASRRLRWVVIAGIVWGGMIDLSLYGVFLGAVVFTAWGHRLLKLRWIGYLLIAASIALVLSLPTIALYAWGSQQDHIHPFGVEHNMWWGASLNSLAIPSVFHPLAPIREAARLVYSGPYNESGAMNFGMVTSVLALLGLFGIVRARPDSAGLAWLTSVGVILGLGLLLRWNGRVIHLPFLRPLNMLIWRVGRSLKPQVFQATPPPPFISGVPLPGLILTALVPFWEGARTVSRYAVVGMLGATALAGVVLDGLPKMARALLIVIWLVEILPNPTASLPVPTQPHPAYAWLAEQDLNPSEGIADLVYPTLRIDGKVIFATALHGRPTASGVGSFMPEHTFVLWDHLLGDPRALSLPETALVFRQYGVRYLFLHVQGDREQGMWAMVQENPGFRPIRCFDPLQGPTPWPYPICVAEVSTGDSVTNLLLRDGWSGIEPWGVWANSTSAWATWYAVKQEGYRLHISAFANWFPGKRQSMRITLNGREVGTYCWEAGETIEDEIEMPPEAVIIGRNHLGFDFEYADLPRDPESGAIVDSRSLSVGFTRLQLMFPFSK